MFKNNSSRYGWPTKLLHWVVGVLVIMQFVYILLKNNLPEADPGIGQLMMLHKSFGFIIFFLGLLFVAWRLINRKPDWPESMPSWQRCLANATHWLMYALVVIMPVSGILMGGLKGFTINFFDVKTICMPWLPHAEAAADFFHFVHVKSALLFGALIILHITGALVHQLFYKDGVLRRMM
jgi:cytochrome b561